MNDYYDYPSELYCIKCDEDVDVVLEDRTEKFIKDGEEIDAPYKIAVCPQCGNVLCNRDFDYAIIRIARKDGLM